MALKEYEVQHRGGRVETLLLSDADVARYKAEGARVAVVGQPEPKAAPKPANKARTARNKGK